MILAIKLLILDLLDQSVVQGLKPIAEHKNTWHLKLSAIPIMESLSIYGP